MGLFSKDIKTFDDLFVHQLQDIYYAEKQLVSALPKMAEKATDAQLKQGFLDHLEQTKGHVARLEKVFKLIDVPARGKKCEAIEGIIGEAKEHMGEIEDERVLDAGIISSAQAVEHYEICRYGTLVEWANDLGYADAAKLLKQNLDEEHHADSLLTEIARGGVNRDAEAA